MLIPCFKKKKKKKYVVAKSLQHTSKLERLLQSNSPANENDGPKIMLFKMNLCRSEF